MDCRSLKILKAECGANHVDFDRDMMLGRSFVHADDSDPATRIFQNFNRNAVKIGERF